MQLFLYIDGLELQRSGTPYFAGRILLRVHSHDHLLLNQNVLPPVKHVGGNIMVWRCVANNGAGNIAFINKMNVLAYIDVLRQNLLDSAKKLSMENTFIFQQDNDPKNTATVTKTWLLYLAPWRLQTSPQSPDLNPIENL
ncbi:uncharacterized protein TNCV_3022151 [Trichonephila clavipes]|nr:uncharacterized protein TNCV_3022151 [Trichonephila clavipes]